MPALPLHDHPQSRAEIFSRRDLLAASFFAAGIMSGAPHQAAARQEAPGHIEAEKAADQRR